MNLLITLRCNQKCPYCFVENSNELSDMTLAELEYIVNLPDFGKEGSVRILGGEPTLHPKLNDFLEIIHEKNENPITIFSNLNCSPAIIEHINIPNIVLVANVLGDSNNINKNASINMEIARNKGWTVILSYTITDIAFDVNAIVNLCKENGIKAVRWSLAMPASDKENIHIEKCITLDVVKKLSLFVDKLFMNGIVSFNDCPLPLCSNVQKVSEVIKRKYNLPNSFQPIKSGMCKPPYDILPGYQIRGCIGIGSIISLDIRNYQSIDEIMNEYQVRVSKLRNLKSPKECQNCNKYHDCGGGCIGYAR